MPFLMMALMVLAGEAEPSVRRPVALGAADQWVFVANRQAGTVSVLDIATRRVVAEHALGQSLRDLIVLPGARQVAVLDGQRGRIVVANRTGAALESAAEYETPPDPVTLQISPDGACATVACRWSACLVIYELPKGGATWQQRALVRLPFSPREQLFLNDAQIVVADAFGGRLAVVDVSQGELLHVHELEGHNIGGLALSATGDQVWLTLQRLNSYRPTTHEDVFWGAVLQNAMLGVKVRRLRSAPTEAGLYEQVYHLGRPNEGAGDPGAILENATGQTMVLLGGVHEVSVRPTLTTPFEQRDLGKRPVALVQPTGSREVFIACEMDDEVCVLDLDQLIVVARIPLGPREPPSDVQLGEALFYDATLSLDGWYSCHSCHTDGHTAGLLNDNFGDNTFGAPKRIPSLLGVADTGPWAWTGKSATLEDQLHKSILRTMQGADASEGVIRPLAAYLQTLEPVPPATLIQRQELDPVGIERGAQVFARHGCGECHAPGVYTTPQAYDVGLHDQVGNREFNPPSLRGVALRQAFFHDNRAETLRDVFEKHGHPAGEAAWDAAELDDLLTFLRSL